MTVETLSTNDVDRNFGLSDQFLEEWAGGSATGRDLPAEVTRAKQHSTNAVEEPPSRDRTSVNSQAAGPNPTFSPSI
jgi:hypothetical protein